MTDSPYKAGVCIHHTKDYQSSFLTLLIRLVLYVCSSHEELPEYFADALFRAGIYVHYTKRYCGRVPTLVTCENILMHREERLRRID